MLPHGRSTRFVSAGVEYRAIPAKFKPMRPMCVREGAAVVIAVLLCLDAGKDATGPRRAAQPGDLMPRRAADRIVDCLAAHGVDRVFCVPGESYLAVLDALHDSNAIQTVVCRHESGAGCMAVGDAKVTGRSGGGGDEVPRLQHCTWAWKTATA
jgi:hypothetical protein